MLAWAAEVSLARQLLVDWLRMSMAAPQVHCCCCCCCTTATTALQERAALLALARSQVDYALGSAGRSYVVGWGLNPPLRVSCAARCINQRHAVKG